MNTRNSWKWLTLACMLPAMLAAQTGKISRQGKEWVEEITGTMAATPRLQVSTPGGQVEVRGGTATDISYRVVKRVRAGSEQEARRKLATAALRARHSNDLTDLSLEALARRTEVGADFFVTVPKAMAHTRAETAGGGMVIENIDGAVFAETAGGDIRADQILGGAKLETAGGSLILGLIRGRISAQTAGGNISLRDGQGEATLQTSGGTISVENCTKTVRASTAGGDVTIRRCGGDVRAETAGGAIRLGVIDGIVVAETAGGGIDVESARGVIRAGSAAGPIRLGRIAGPVRAETAAGNISATVTADRASWAESLLGTHMGDVVVYIPANLAMTIHATVDMASSRQAIRSDFPIVFRTIGDFPAMSELIGDLLLNGGGPPLRIRTTSGTIQILRVINK